MGTHISRVKSVDLDAWTDEQLQSVLKWGNTRANKYWEAKLAPGHVPSEAKIENFIRTKDESKRWVMDGPMPDPSTLDADDDDDVPLSVVKEKQNLERSASQRAVSDAGPAQVRRAPQPDLFGEDTFPPTRADSAPSTVPQKSDPAPPKQTKPADSLLGLDFFGEPAPPPNRPASAASTPGAQSRPDLKQSILSLYASRPQQPQQPSHSSSASFGGMHSPPLPPQQQHQQPHQPSLGGMEDAFGGLSFSSTPSQPLQTQPKPNAFSNLGNLSSHRSASQQTAAPPSSLGGGSFFDVKTTQPPAQPLRGLGTSTSLGSFNSTSRAAPAAAPKASASSGLGDLFDFSTPSAPPSVPPKPQVASPPQQSIFNLSSPAPAPAPKSQSAAPALSGWNNHDAWGSNAAWGASPPLNQTAPAPRPSGAGFGWGTGGSVASQSITPGAGGGFAAASSGQPPKVSADEDFGGWSSAAPATPAVGTAPPKPGAGFTTNEDLFSNVWE
jgi:stromal membrane-associated protein